MNGNNLPEELKLVEQLTTLLDDKFRIPIINVRFGLDPVLGLIPGVGDLISKLISLLILASFLRHGVPLRILLKMLFNLLVDSVIGVIPLLGDVFDVYFKANRRNLRMAKEYFTQQQNAEQTKRSHV